MKAPLTSYGLGAYPRLLLLLLTFINTINAQFSPGLEEALSANAVPTGLEAQFPPLPEHSPIDNGHNHNRTRLFYSLIVTLFPESTDSPSAKEQSLVVHNVHPYPLFIAIYHFDDTKISNLPTLSDERQYQRGLNLNSEMTKFEIHKNLDAPAEFSSQVINTKLPPHSNFTYTDYGSMEGFYFVFITSVGVPHEKRFNTVTNFARGGSRDEGEFEYLTVFHYKNTVVFRLICYVLFVLNLLLLGLILTGFQMVNYGLLGLALSLSLHALSVFWTKYLDFTNIQVELDQIYRTQVIKLEYSYFILLVLSSFIIFWKSPSVYRSVFTGYSFIILIVLHVVSLIRLATLYNPALYDKLNWFNHNSLLNVFDFLLSMIPGGLMISYVIQEYLPFLRVVDILGGPDIAEDIEDVQLLEEAKIWKAIDPLIGQSMIAVKVLSLDVVAKALVHQFVDPEYIFTPGVGVSIPQLLKSPELTKQFLNFSLSNNLLYARYHVLGAAKWVTVIAVLVWVSLKSDNETKQKEE